ncbi:hypothetical protein PC9H_010250 [Pleurotus ostreatus]|uniref:Uncharacterized protein n=1 Tax=Pleurotus ostreatus TaxID=5322 RepID=A0A8H7DMQ2_PLEOS|nr:uncharacterized protein PC9H_011220 [Pleurotus ostreatus]XP_036629133.1 uncharacterized protein PC9H_010250 [Pleurotus ostreatus]KAF7423056.1 hypothetical protein PC9H_011220 [Pleurotus ostreatus]KAF7424939.1 hypothetical protein PC9H_010250 [Pleurotus ostreatus]
MRCPPDDLDPRLHVRHPKNQVPRPVWSSEGFPAGLDASGRRVIVRLSFLPVPAFRFYLRSASSSRCGLSAPVLSCAAFLHTFGVPLPQLPGTPPRASSPPPGGVSTHQAPAHAPPFSTASPPRACSSTSGAAFSAADNFAVSCTAFLRRDSFEGGDAHCDCYGCDDGARADGQWEAEGHFAVFGIWREFVLQSALTPGGQELATQFTTRLVLFVNAPTPAMTIFKHEFAQVKLDFNLLSSKSEALLVILPRLPEPSEQALRAR